MNQPITQEEKVAFMEGIFNEHYKWMMSFVHHALPKENLRVVDRIVLSIFAEALDNIDTLQNEPDVRKWLMNTAVATLRRRKEEKKFWKRFWPFKKYKNKQ